MNKHLLALAAMAATGASFAANKVDAPTASNQPQLHNIEGMKLGEKPAAKNGVSLTSKANAKELGEKAQAVAKEAIAQASGLAKATVGKADAKFGLAKSCKPVAAKDHFVGQKAKLQAPGHKLAKNHGRQNEGAHAA